MSMHNQPGHTQHGGHGPENLDSSLGYEASDVRVSGIVTFLVCLVCFVVVSGGICWEIGKVINARMNKEDGPTSKWSKTVDVRQLGNMPSSPELQNRMAEITQSFPTPRVQTDDGAQDIVDLHGREDLLLDHYTWIDESKGTVRIPIARAMELIAQRGLPAAPAVQRSSPMFGDKAPVVTMPLTDGFAPTALDQQEAQEARK